MEEKTNNSLLLSQEKEALDACVKETSKILSKSAAIVEEINHGFKDIKQKNDNLRKQMANGVRKTDGDDSFLL